jgi:5'-deoxynucleotidase YfbR-like HD superfamily hydrolase
VSRSGDWILTATGARWYLTDPDPDDVDLHDIAHALSNICRFGGHTRKFYSVAEHSLRVFKAMKEAGCGPTLCLWGLLHDAPEAYLGDVVRPLKYSMPIYRAWEGQTEAVIWHGLKIPLPTPEGWRVVKMFDDVLLMTERRDIMFQNGHEWSCKAEPLQELIEPWESSVAKNVFIATFETYFELSNAEWDSERRAP